MKIFFLICSLANAHGVERTITDKINYMADQGHEITLVTYEQGQHPYAYELSTKVNHVDLNCRYFTLYKYFFLKRIFKQYAMKRRFKMALKELIFEYHPEVLVTTAYESHYMREIMFFRSSVRIIIESHSAFAFDISGNTLFRYIKNFFYLKTIKRCHLLVALTQGDALFWIKHKINVIVTPNPLPFYYEKLDLKSCQKGRIIAVGRFYDEKRFDRLIDAFALIANKYSDWFIEIFGEGPNKESLQMQINNLCMQNRVRLQPPTKDIVSEYMKSEFFVLSSDIEGFGLVVLEAMACGLPVVATNCPYGPSEIVEDGQTGLLAKMEVKDLSNKIEWMITHDAERKDMGDKAHQEVSRYKKDIVMKEWEKVYKSVL